VGTARVGDAHLCLHACERDQHQLPTLTHLLRPYSHAPRNARSNDGQRTELQGARRDGDGAADDQCVRIGLDAGPRAGIGAQNEASTRARECAVHAVALKAWNRAETCLRWMRGGGKGAASAAPPPERVRTEPRVAGVTRNVSGHELCLTDALHMACKSDSPRTCADHRDDIRCCREISSHHGFGTVYERRATSQHPRSTSRELRVRTSRSQCATDKTTTASQRCATQTPNTARAVTAAAARVATREGTPQLHPVRRVGLKDEIC